MRHSFKVAFATADHIHINQHFGAATGFAIYSLDGEYSKLVAMAEFSEARQDGNEDKLTARMSALEGCTAVFCQAVGGSAMRQLMARGIQPIRLESVEPIDLRLAVLRRAIRDGSVPWINKALRRDTDPDRFERMAAEGWNND